MARLKKVEPTQLTPRREEAARMPAALGPFEEMERLMDAVFGRTFPRSLFPSLAREPWFTTAPAVTVPRVDIVDHEDEIILRAELPGVRKEDLDVSMTGNTVTIRGCSHREIEEERGDYYRCEMSRGEFSRTVTLPGQVDESRASAKLDEGILELTLPKVETSKRKSIKID